MEQRRRARAAVVAAAVAVASVAATLAVLAAARGGARPAALAPQPFLAPYTEFNADEGSAGPAHNRAALDFQAGKAGASQEWLQYSLHHDGTLQQARARRGVRAVRGAAARTERARADTGSQPRGAVESSGNFQDDDGSLFGDDTFDAAEASKGEPMPYQEDGAPQDGSDDEDYYCVDEHGNEVDCGDDYYCVDEQGNEVDCDEEEEEPEEEEPGPSDFLKSMVKAVASEAMPPDASRVLKESVKSVQAAKEELKAAAKLKAKAEADEEHAKRLQGREAELEEYQHEKQKFADSLEQIARKADDEYHAEEDQVLEMDGEARGGDGGGVSGVATEGGAGKSGGEGDAALRQRLQRHLPLLRVVDKLAQRVGTLKGRGRHPRSQRQLPPKA